MMAWKSALVPDRLTSTAGVDAVAPAGDSLEVASAGDSLAVLTATGCSAVAHPPSAVSASTDSMRRRFMNTPKCDQPDALSGCGLYPETSFLLDLCPSRETGHRYPYPL